MVAASISCPMQELGCQPGSKAMVGHLSLRNGAARAADLGVLSLEALPVECIKQAVEALLMEKPSFNAF